MLVTLAIEMLFQWLSTSYINDIHCIVRQTVPYLHTQELHLKLFSSEFIQILCFDVYVYSITFPSHSSFSFSFFSVFHSLSLSFSLFGPSSHSLMTILLADDLISQ